MGTVIGLASVFRTRYAPAPRQRAREPGEPWFSLRDRDDLDAWASHGRRAVLVSSEMGMFAMLHEGGQTWASWGIVRQSRGLLVWNCITLADVDRFATMADALAAIDGETEPTLVANVVSFRTHFEAGSSRRLASSR